MSESNGSDFDAEAAAGALPGTIHQRGAEYRLTYRRFDRKPTIRDIPFDSTDQLIDRWSPLVVSRRLTRHPICTTASSVGSTIVP